MIKFKKTPESNLERVFKNAQGVTLYEQVPDGTDICIYTLDLFSTEGKESTDLKWSIPFLLWFGDETMRKTAEGRTLSPEPFNTGVFSWKVFKEDGLPTYPITRSTNSNDVYAAIIDANQRCAELIVAKVEGLEMSDITIVL